jgi:hypothetical protein
LIAAQLFGAGTRFCKLSAVLDAYGLHVVAGGCSDVAIAGYMQGAATASRRKFMA